MNEISERVHAGQRSILLNFKNTRSITAAAALNFHATVSLLRRREPDLRFRAINMGRIQQIQLLRSTGFLREDVSIDDQAITLPQILPIRTGLSHDGGSIVQKLVDDMDTVFYSGGLDEDLQRKNYLYKAINEALLNVSQHAYEEFDKQFLEAVGNRWWMFGQQIGTQLHIVFCDKGHGIPVTLPRHDLFETVEMIYRKYIGQGHDAALIFAATQLKRSKHVGTGHGYGLSDILRFATNNPNGILRVFSNKGLYTLENRVVSPNHKRREHKHSLHGTLIQWNISLETEGVKKH